MLAAASACAFISPFLKQSKKLARDYLANTVAQAPHVFDISEGGTDGHVQA